MEATTDLPDGPVIMDFPFILTFVPTEVVDVDASEVMPPLVDGTDATEPEIVEGSSGSPQDYSIMVPLPPLLVTDVPFPSEIVSPDYYEINPEIVKAELSFYSTPRTEDYGEAVYGTLKKIEMTCAASYANMCAPAPTIDMMSWFARSMMMADTASSRVADFKTHAMSFGQNIEVPNEMPVVHVADVIKNRSRNLRGKSALNERELFEMFGGANKMARVTETRGGRFVSQDDRGDNQGRDHPDRPDGPPPRPDGPPHDGPRPGPPHDGPHPGPPHDGPRPDGPRPDGPEPYFPWSPIDGNESGDESDGEPDDHDSDSDNEHEDEHHNRHHGHGHWGPPPPQEDTLFIGALGFGTEGDMCMYQNFNQLPPPCQSAVADLHILRKQYWEEVGDSAGHHFNGGLEVGMILAACWLSMIVLIAFGLRRISSITSRNMNQKEIKAMLTVIEANPALKAQCKSFQIFQYYNEYIKYLT